MKISFILGLFCLLSVHTFGQQAKTSLEPNKRIEALNNYVDYINASIHGMTVVKTLLVEFNQELNKYVDLESVKVNDINEYISHDIFSEIEYYPSYKIMPYNMKDRCIAAATVLDATDQSSLNTKLEKMNEIIKASNKLRMDVSSMIKELDLNKKENVQKVYEQLEIGVKNFNLFYQLEKDMTKAISVASDKYQSKTALNLNTYTELSQLSNLCKQILVKLRAKEGESLGQIVTLLDQKLSKCQKIKLNLSVTRIDSVNNEKLLKSALSEAKKISEIAHNFTKDEPIPARYKYYGRFYYSYSEIMDRFNTIGTGINLNLNQLFQNNKFPFVRLVEMPPLFQIIYPNKIESKEVIKASDEVVVIPQVVKERTVTSGKIMKVDNNVVELELYDHMIQDGDVVSINFNGDWILEKEELERGSKKIKLQLNKEGKNFLLLHADNVGKRPPNTMALSYMFRGSKKEIVLKSDNNTSELIEIILVK